MISCLSALITQLPREGGKKRIQLKVCGKHLLIMKSNTQDESGVQFLIRHTLIKELHFVQMSVASIGLKIT